jgi:hypothetical protein
MSIGELLISLLKNPAVLGFIAVALTWILRKFKWPVTGTKAIWMTYVVALGLGVAEKLLLEGWPAIITCDLNVADPPVFAMCVVTILGNIGAWTGLVFGVATGIYKVLRAKMLFGERI